MVGTEDVSGESSALAQLALLVDDAWDSSRVVARLRFQTLVERIAKEETALKFRIARLLAWWKAKDVSTMGYSGWFSCAKEYSPWEQSRLRDHIRLVESELDLIKTLVSRGTIGVTLATRAVRDLGPKASLDKQVDWFNEVAHDPLPARHRSRMVEIKGKSVRVVEKALGDAKILIGWSAPLPALERFVIDCWQKKLTVEQLLEAARAVPPRPARLDKTVPEWKDEPAREQFGEWVEPRDQEHCKELLLAVRGKLERRRMVLAMACAYIQEHELWRMGKRYTSVGKYCTERLAFDQRTFQRYAREGRSLVAEPEARHAIEEGLTVDRALFAVERAWGSPSVEPFLDLARRLDCVEMERAAELQEPVEDAYANAVGMAKQVESAAATGIGTAAEAGPDVAAIAAHVLATRGAATPIGTIRVALRDAAYRGPRPPPPSSMFVLPELLPAAKWWVETVQVPEEHGIRATVVHDCYCCQNPRCRRITIRVHTHHIHPKELGGSDEPWNLITLCPSCHLRGIHSDRMRLVRIRDWLVWTWPDGGVAITWSPMETG